MVRRSPLYDPNHHCYGALLAKWAAQYFRAHGALWFKALKHHTTRRCYELALSRRNTARSIFRAERGAGKGASRASRRCLLWRYCALLRLLRAAAAIRMLCACSQDMKPPAPGCSPSTIWSARVRWKGRDRTLTAVHAMLPQCSPSLFILCRCTFARLYTAAASTAGCNGWFPGGI